MCSEVDAACAAPQSKTRKQHDNDSTRPTTPSKVMHAPSHYCTDSSPRLTLVVASVFVSRLSALETSYVEMPSEL